MTSNGAFEYDQEVLRKDFGFIVLYRRSDHKVPRWNCRIKIDGSKGYSRRSCKTTEKSKAIRIAEDYYRNLVVRQQQTGTIHSKSFRKVIDEYLLHMKHSMRSSAAIQEYRERLNNYAVEYFGDRPIDQITNADLVDFLHWRRTNGRRVAPANSTIAKEFAPLRQAINFACSKNYTSTKLDVPRFSNKGRIRPHFTKKEYRLLIIALRSWVKESKTNHPRTFRDRFYLQQYVLLLSNCGCRIGEIRKLRWRDIQEFEFDKTSRGMCFWVSGKTGKRQVIPQQDVKKYLTRIQEFRRKELSKLPDENEFVFCHKDGTQVGSFRKGFTALLNQSGLLTDQEGNRHTLYSLRHTYAVFRISEEVNQFLLATNMGTSVQMLQKHYLKLTPEVHAAEITKTKGNQFRQ